MARPRYSAAKRQREIRKQLERQRKLARKHGKRAGSSAAVEGSSIPPQSISSEMGGDIVSVEASDVTTGHDETSSGAPTTTSDPE